MLLQGRERLAPVIPQMNVAGLTFPGLPELPDFPMPDLSDLPGLDLLPPEARTQLTQALAPVVAEVEKHLGEARAGYERMVAMRNDLQAQVNSMTTEINSAAAAATALSAAPTLPDSLGALGMLLNVAQRATQGRSEAASSAITEIQGKLLTLTDAIAFATEMVDTLTGGLDRLRAIIEPPEPPEEVEFT